MPSLKDVQIKIGAVKKTQQITKAMNMVATSRLRGAQTAMEHDLFLLHNDSDFDAIATMVPLKIY